MRIIVEGNDKTGKTTLVNFLSKELNFEIIKFSQPKTKDSFTEYVDFFGTEKENKKWLTKNDNIICDRSWIGEQVYGPIYRKSKMKKFQVKKLDLACKANNDLIIFCNTDKTLIKKKFIEDGEKFTQAKDVGRIEKYFIKTIQSLKTNVITYDRRVGNMESIALIIKSLNKWE